MTADGAAADDGQFADAVLSALFARRIVLLRGVLDDARASQAAAALMTLDGLGDEHVELRISVSSGDLEAGLMLIDIIEVLGVPVHTVAVGLVGGGAVGVLAAGSRRTLSRHARVHLREPNATASGRALEIERTLAERSARRALFFEHLSHRTGRRVGDIEEEWRIGRFLDAADAVTLGYADSTEARASAAS